ncbi:tejas isoform X2 [Musca autumnalis]
MDSGFLNEVKAIIKSLVISCPDKITIDKLNRDYRDVEGQDIPYRRLGYHSLEQFLRQIPDTVVVVGSGHTAYVYFVGNDKSAHIHEMIMGQKKSRPRSRGKAHANKFANTQRHSSRQNNKASSGSSVGRRQHVQPLSPFQITNRNVSTRKLTVRDVPLQRNAQQLPAHNLQNMQTPALNLLGNINRSQFGGVPQRIPGIPIINIQQQVATNREIIRKYQEHVKQLESLLRPTSVPQRQQQNAYSRVAMPPATQPITNRNETKIDNSKQYNQQNPYNRDAMSSATQPVTNRNETKSDNSKDYIPRNQVPVKPYENHRSPTTQNSSDGLRMANTPTTNTNQPSTDTKDSQNQNQEKTTYQEDAKKLENLLTTSCRITDSAPPRKVTFSVEANIDMKITVADSKPKPKMRLSERLEKILNATTPPRKWNPVEDIVENGETPEPKVTISPSKPTRKNDSTTNQFQKLLDITEEDIDNDSDEAVPEFAATSNVFRLDLPKYTVPFGRKIDPCEIPEDVDVGTCLGIFVSEIHNPFRFWFHIHKEKHELDALMHQMERYYGTMEPSELRIPIVCLNPGQVCAAAFNEMWHRAEIVAPPVKNKIKVSFIDYGTVSDVDICDVKYLGTCFSQLPAQALRGCLSNIKPRGLHWSHEATMHFLSLVSERMLYAKITEIDRENSVFYMVLCDTHNEEVVQINKSMVEMKHALYNEDWKKTKIEMNNGRRVHHPREDFPT